MRGTPAHHHHSSHHRCTTNSRSAFHMALAGRRLAGVAATAVLILCLQAISTTQSSSVGKFPLLMPNVAPSHAESYLCTPVKVDNTKTYYIVGFEPAANMDTAHHILIYGCGEPGSDKPVWNCGEMAQSSMDDEISASPCGQGSHTQIVYAWARNAKRLDLPKDVGFKVGKDSPITYLVLQVHYAHTLPMDTKDSSGVIIEHTEQVMPKQASILLLGTSGVIGPHRVEHMETACTIDEQKTIYPFAYRTHTHSLGKVVSGYRVRQDENGEDQWTLLGKRDPLTPQMFYPVMNTEPIRPGDRLAARCTMESHRDRSTIVGMTNDDEMCNFYLMYYTDNEEPLNTKYCFSKGPPYYYWRNADSGLHNIPEMEASSLH